MSRAAETEEGIMTTASTKGNEKIVNFSYI